MSSFIVIFFLTTCCLLINAQNYDYQQSQQQPRHSGPSDSRPAPTPVPILKQINKHNDDGSYTYGYEGADGSFKIETKLATGEVKGKYGYVDETGKVRVVEYGANKYGFQPSGEGITVPPPTYLDETTNRDGLSPDYEDEIQPQKPYIARPRPQQSRPVSHHARPTQNDIPVQRPQYNRQEYHQERPQEQEVVYQQRPPRLQVPGAAPSDITYSEHPRPARPDPEYTQSQTFSSQPQQAVRISRPVYAPAPAARSHQFNVPEQQEYAPQAGPGPVQQQQQYSRPAAPQGQGRSTSVLDQLAKDYALPQGGSQPLHDISFGYY